MKDKFNDNPTDTDGRGGFYFTTNADINKFYRFGINIREIILPTQHPDFRMIKLFPHDKKIYSFDKTRPYGMTEINSPANNEYKFNSVRFRSNMIILGKKYSLLDNNTYQKFNLDPKENIHIINNISAEADIESLNLWKSFGTDLEYTRAMDYASEAGRIQTLDWFFNSGLDLKYSEHAMDVIRREHNLRFDLENDARIKSYTKVKVLDWWFNSGLKLKYSKQALCNAYYAKNVPVLDWWIRSGLNLKYSDKTIDDAVRRRFESYEWFDKDDDYDITQRSIW